MFGGEGTEFVRSNVTKTGRGDARFRDFRDVQSCGGGKSLSLRGMTFFFLWQRVEERERREGIVCDVYVSGFGGVCSRHWVVLALPSFSVRCGFFVLCCVVFPSLPGAVYGGATKSAVDFSYRFVVVTADRGRRDGDIT